MYSIDQNEIILPAEQIDLKNFYKYAVVCALPEGKKITKTIDNQNIQYEGSLGLAPDWESKPLSETGKKWLSACIFAHTNHFGVKIPFSARASHPNVKKVTTRKELVTFTVEEGAFYGNMFSPLSPAFFCQGNSKPTDSEYFKKRICASSEKIGTPSQCGFMNMGKCANVCQKKDAVDGSYSKCQGLDQVYDEVMTVFLKTKEKRIP